MKELLKIMNYIQENMKRSKGNSSGYVGLKSSKTRFEQIERDKSFPVIKILIFKNNEWISKIQPVK